MSEGMEGPQKVVNMENERLFSRKTGESLSQYKRRLTHGIQNLENMVAILQQGVVEHTNGQQAWSAEVAKLEGMRHGELSSDMTLPQREAALHDARRRLERATENLEWDEVELQRAETQLTRLRQFRKALDLQTRYAKDTGKTADPETNRSRLTILDNPSPEE